MPTSDPLSSRPRSGSWAIAGNSFRSAAPGGKSCYPSSKSLAETRGLTPYPEDEHLATRRWRLRRGRFLVHQANQQSVAAGPYEEEDPYDEDSRFRIHAEHASAAAAPAEELELELAPHEEAIDEYDEDERFRLHLGALQDSALQDSPQE